MESQAVRKTFPQISEEQGPQALRSVRAQGQNLSPFSFGLQKRLRSLLWTLYTVEMVYLNHTLFAYSSHSNISTRIFDSTLIFQVRSSPPHGFRPSFLSRSP